MLLTNISVVCFVQAVPPFTQLGDTFKEFLVHKLPKYLVDLILHRCMHISSVKNVSRQGSYLNIVKFDLI